MTAEIGVAVPLAAVKTCSSCYAFYTSSTAWRQAVIYFQVQCCYIIRVCCNLLSPTKLENNTTVVYLFIRLYVCVFISSVLMQDKLKNLWTDWDEERGTSSDVFTN